MYHENIYSSIPDTCHMTDELVVFLNQQWYNSNIGTKLVVRFLAIVKKSLILDLS